MQWGGSNIVVFSAVRQEQNCILWEVKQKKQIALFWAIKRSKIAVIRAVKQKEQNCGSFCSEAGAKMQYFVSEAE